MLFVITRWVILVAAVGGGLFLISLISAAIFITGCVIPVGAVDDGRFVISLISAAIYYYRMGGPNLSG